MEKQDLNIIETSSIDVIEASQRAEFDIQIMTAKRYPRDLKRIKDNCLAIVTMDKEIAASCRYALPRGGKSISGPSVHLARIIAQQYGNIRVDAKIKQVTDKQIVSEAVCFDLETNYACKVEVRRSIIGKTGRFNDDMITVTGNAANSIAFRNAVLNVVPKGITDLVYKASMNVLTGDLTDEQKLVSARKKAFDYFKSEYNISEEQVLNSMGLRSVNQVKSEQIADLRAMMQAIKDGDSTPEEMFNLKTEVKNPFEEQKTENKEQPKNIEKNETDTGKLFPEGNQK
ncbi:MAG: hypothetical protein JXA68_04210 [Ignavibacteriales bacterium]|nr:hypothetical protein [Ignavibacteriales bacterium]